MVCVAITRGGWGEAWLFDTLEEADLHPLIQYGDAFVSRPEDVLTQYNLLDLHVLMRIIGDEDLKQRVLTSIPPKDAMSWSDRTARVVPHTRAIFDALVGIARSVPEDPTVICETVRRDRQLYIQERKTMDTKAPENKAAGAAPAAKAEKTPKPPKYADDAKITLLSDKDGKKYGKDHNPKREGSKSHGRFATYKDGLTVKQFLDAGGTTGDLDYDIKKAYIKVG